jgi:hypothetical protein
MQILQDITWREFITYLSVAFLIYYGAAIFFLIRQWLKAAKTAPAKKTTWSPTTEEIKEIVAVTDDQETIAKTTIGTKLSTVPSTSDEENNRIIEFSNQLEIIVDDSRQSPQMEIILQQLAKLLPNYRDLYTDLLKAPLITVIQKRFREECNIEVSFTEIELIWKNNNPLEEFTGSVVG